MTAKSLRVRVAIVRGPRKRNERTNEEDEEEEEHKPLRGGAMVPRGGPGIPPGWGVKDAPPGMLFRSVDAYAPLHVIFQGRVVQFVHAVLLVFTLWTVAH